MADPITVELAERSYPVHIGVDLLGDRDLWSGLVAGPRAMIVSNEVVAPIYLDTLRGALPVEAQVHLIPDGEQHKKIQTMTGIIDALIEGLCGRDTTVIALGGGVVGDIAGFAAACYMRGVPVIQVPTTVLAQVDASVGGKTGVNHKAGKNLIGAFHQPKAVVVDVSTLETLAEREYRAGLAEVIKYALIADVPFAKWLKKHADKIKRRDPEALIEMTRRSVEHKARIVAEDEREGGKRALLNFGHTFGHAIERVQGYGDWLHGEAVAAGMVIAADLSARLDLIGENDVNEVIELLKLFGLPVTPPDVSRSEIFGAMGLDKKMRDDTLRFVVLDRIGAASVADSVPADILSATLEKFFE